MADVTVVFDDGGFAEMMVKVGLDVQRRCIMIEAAAKAVCPVDTGRLRSSITHEVSVRGDEVIGRIGTNVNYAPYIELGTRFMAARSFLRSALAAGAR